MLKPILQTPRYRLVADQIAQLIRDGEIPLGSKMPADKDLVQQLGVSRTTVREAMIALELMGYVVTRFGAGAFTTETLPDAVTETNGLPGFFELVEARYSIEPEIAAIAASTVTEADITHLRACIEILADPGLALDDFENADRDFHITIARSTGNSVFVSIVEEFWRVRQRFPEWTRTTNRQNPADIARFFRDEHTDIVDALANADAAAARTAMRIHCRNSGQPLLERWRQVEEGALPGNTVVKRISTWQEEDLSSGAKARGRTG